MASVSRLRPGSMAYHALLIDDGLLEHSRLMQPEKTSKDPQQCKKKFLLHVFCDKGALDMHQHTLKSVPSR